MIDKIVNRALKVKLYPSQEQKTFLDKSLGLSRFFYNYLLNERIEFYKTEGEHHIRDVNASINLKNEVLNIRMRRAEFKPMESIEYIHLLAMQALNIGASDEAERTTCERVHKAYSLKTVGSLPLII